MRRLRLQPARLVLAGAAVAALAAVGLAQGGAAPAAAGPDGTGPGGAGRRRPGSGAVRLTMVVPAPPVTPAVSVTPAGTTVPGAAELPAVPGQQRVEHRHLPAAGRPAQRRLAGQHGRRPHRPAPRLRARSGRLPVRHPGHGRRPAGTGWSGSSSPTRRRATAGPIRSARTPPSRAAGTPAATATPSWSTPRTCTLYELWNARYTAGGSTAGSGAIWNLQVERAAAGRLDLGRRRGPADPARPAELRPGPGGRPARPADHPRDPLHRPADPVGLHLAGPARGRVGLKPRPAADGRPVPAAGQLHRSAGSAPAGATGTAGTPRPSWWRCSTTG